MNRKIQRQPAALVTGGARRIGKALALELAVRGHPVVLHYHYSKKQAETTASEIRKLGGRCELFFGDFTNEKSIKKLIPQVRKKFKNLGLLINNASVFKKSGLTTNTRDMKLFHDHFAVNFTAPYLLSCDFVRYYKKGQIINILDTHITDNTTVHPSYLLSKKTLAEFTKLAAARWAPKVRVNGIAPGLILPPEKKGADHLRRLARSVPLKKRGHVRQVIAAMDYLLANEYVTGQILFADGGEHLN